MFGPSIRMDFELEMVGFDFVFCSKYNLELLLINPVGLFGSRSGLASRHRQRTWRSRCDRSGQGSYLWDGGHERLEW